MKLSRIVADDERMAGVVIQDVFVGGDGLRRVRVR